MYIVIILFLKSKYFDELWINYIGIYSRRQQIWPHFETSLTSQKLLLAPEILCTLSTHVHKFSVEILLLELSRHQCYVRFPIEYRFHISKLF